MRITVVMNTLKEKPVYLKEAIESYLNQISVDVELIVSTVEGDWSIDYIKERYPSVKIVTMTKEEHSPNGERSPVGAYLQLNNALPHVTGKYFCYASSNDYAKKDKLIQEYSLLKQFKKDVCYSSFYLVNDKGDLISRFRVRDYDFMTHLDTNYVSDCSMISVDLLKKYTPFDPSLKNLAFWDMWLRIYEGEGDVFIKNDKPTWFYRQHSTSMRAIRLKNKEKQEKEMAERKLMTDAHRLKINCIFD